MHRQRSNGERRSCAEHAPGYYRNLLKLPGIEEQHRAPKVKKWNPNEVFDVEVRSIILFHFAFLEYLSASIAKIVRSRVNLVAVIIVWVIPFLFPIFERGVYFHDSL
jgi:hypothetical protein